METDAALQKDITLMETYAALWKALEIKIYYSENLGIGGKIILELVFGK
jgi:hypothetical protein